MASSSSSSKFRNIPLHFMDRCDTLEEWEPCFDMLSTYPTDWCQQMLMSMKFLDISDEKQGIVIKKPIQEAKENRNALYFKMEMPKGMKKENVEITVKNGTVTVVGSLSYIGVDEEEESLKNVCKGKMFLRPAGIYMVYKIKAQLKNGVLSIVIPKDVKKKSEVNKDELIIVKVA
ncbi:hypothetical protein ACHQM5_029676 [Ranunculus cassubicifolius]